MVSKVELDLLEESDTPGGEGPPEENEPAQKGRVQSFFASMTRKKIIGTAVLCCALCIFGIYLLVYTAGEKSPVSIDTQRVNAKTQNAIENLEGFIIDLTDEHGRHRVLVCDITVEMDPGRGIGEYKAEVRKKTYDALKSKSAYGLKTAGYTTIKKEMKEELNRILRGGVQEVYFTKFVIL